MRKVQLLPTRDYEAGYGPALACFKMTEKLILITPFYAWKYHMFYHFPLFLKPLRGGRPLPPPHDAAPVWYLFAVYFVYFYMCVIFSR